MGRVFQTLSEGLAKFIYGWLVPSSIALALALFLLPDLAHKYPSVAAAMERLPDDSVQQILAFGVGAVALSTLLSLSLALPLTRLLEGYSGPERLRAWLRKREVARYRRLRLLSSRRDVAASARASAQRELLHYPRQETKVLPTRLGNRLRASELFGRDAYGLDALALWYEIVSSSPETSRSTVTDERSAFDFYISSILNTIAIAAFSIVVGITAGSVKAYIVLGVCALLLPVCYRGAVAQSSEYGAAIRGMVNCSRVALAESLGYSLPDKISKEQRFWRSLAWGLFAQPGDLADLDEFRLSPESRMKSTA